MEECYFNQLNKQILDHWKTWKLELFPPSRNTLKLTILTGFQISEYHITACIPTGE